MRKSAIVRTSADGSTSSSEIPIARLQRGGRPVEPPGVLAVLRDDATATRGQRLASFRTCGGIVLGHVADADVLGPPSTKQGSNFRCPNTGQHHIVVPQPPGSNARSRCSRDIPLYLRTLSLQDRIGVLKAGATFGIDGQVDSKTLITVLGPPVTLRDPAHFYVKTDDLADCRIDAIP